MTATKIQSIMPSLSLADTSNLNTGKLPNNPTSEPQLLKLGPDLTVYIGAERDARFIYKEIYQDHCYDFAQLPPNPCTQQLHINLGKTQSLTQAP